MLINNFCKNVISKTLSHYCKHHNIAINHKCFKVTAGNSRRNYCNDVSNKTPVLPSLLPDTKPLLWPEFFKSLRNFIYKSFFLPKLDPDFEITEFLEGTKQAVSIISHALSEENYQFLEDLVAPEAVEPLKDVISSLTQEQKESIAVKKDDIYMAFPFEIGIIFKDENDGEKRFVEITVVLHSIKDFKAKMTEEVAQGKILTPFNLGALGDGSSAFVANYRFIKEVTKGVQSSWIVNMINHFAVISVKK